MDSKFSKLVQQVQAHTGNCQESIDDFKACTNIPELVQVMKKYWATLIDEAPQQLKAVFAANYKTYAAEINKAGLYYNEIPPRGIVLIGDMPKSFKNPIEVHSSMKSLHVYVVGKAHVRLYGDARCYCNCPDAVIELRDISVANVRAGRAIARNQSNLTIIGKDYEQYDAAHVVSLVE